MNTTMTNNLAAVVQGVIKTYIDGVGDKKITERTLEKLDKLHKEFRDNICNKLKPTFKDFTEIKEKVTELKKVKPKKGASKVEKIDLNKGIIIELVSLAKRNCVQEEVIEAHKEFVGEVKFIQSCNIYEQWINWALDFGEDSYLATHIAKLTHSSSKGSSIDVRHHGSCSKYSSQYICTDEQPELDTAYPDNKYSSISQLYNIKVEGQYIGDLLREGGAQYLRAFTKHDDLLNIWVDSFSKYIRNNSKKSYFLSKQTYFPTQKAQYHLLLPLASSSLIHTLHLKHKNYWDDDQVLARKQKSEKKYSPVITCTYPNKAYIHVTGSNHSNASSLNGKRGGRIALLPNMPPQWRSRLASYIERTTVFDKALAFELREKINELKNYLLLIKNKSLSINEPKRNAAVMNKLQTISSQLFNYVETINSNETMEGWTIESKLPIEQQLMFEPWREDEAAKVLKINKEWQKTLSKTYGRWLNQQLTQKSNLMPTTIHAALWADCFLLELREMVATREVTL
jgi:CRISPR-associated protein Csy1